MQLYIDLPYDFGEKTAGVPFHPTYGELTTPASTAKNFGYYAMRRHGAICNGATKCWVVGADHSYISFNSVHGRTGHFFYVTNTDSVYKRDGSVFYDSFEDSFID